MAPAAQLVCSTQQSFRRRKTFPLTYAVQPHLLEYLPIQAPESGTPVASHAASHIPAERRGGLCALAVS